MCLVYMHYRMSFRNSDYVCSCSLMCYKCIILPALLKPNLYYKIRSFHVAISNGFKWSRHCLSWICTISFSGLTMWPVSHPVFCQLIDGGLLTVLPWVHHMQSLTWIYLICQLRVTGFNMTSWKEEKWKAKIYPFECRVPNNSRERWESLSQWSVQRNRGKQ